MLSTLRLSTMNQLEEGIWKYYKREIQCDIAPDEITSALYKKQYIDKRTFDEINAQTREGKSRDQIWGTLRPRLISCCSFAKFWEVLSCSGYEKLSIEILLRYWYCSFKSHVGRGPDRSKCGNQDYFLRLKVCFHDRVFKEPHKLLRKRSEDFRVKFENAISVEKRMEIADRYAVCLCILIDTKALEFTQNLPTHDLFDRLERILPETSNPLLTEVALFSRKAIAYGMVEKLDEGRECMTKAQVAAFNIDQQTQYVYNMLYIQIHFLCMEVSSSPTSDDIGRILLAAERFLQSLVTHDKGALFWYKMTVLRIACFLLGISHKGIINPNQRVEKKHMLDAKRFLAVIDKHWDGIEYIRKLYYHVCRARIQELELQFISAEGRETEAYQRSIECLKAAVERLQITIAEDGQGNFRETPFAEKYCQMLCNIIERA